MLETSPLPETMPDPDELEGCLSVPGERYPTGRADWARVVGVDIDNNPISVEGTGYLARCLQHETDHLAGHLYLDRLVGRNHRAARKMIKRRQWTDPGNTWYPGRTVTPSLGEWYDVGSLLRVIDLGAIGGGDVRHD